MSIQGPTVQRRLLSMELKKCRENAGLTQEQVARHFEWNPAKVMRLETSRGGVTARDTRDLLKLYGVDDEDYQEKLVAWARRSKERAWWNDYKDIMRPGNYVALESEASCIRMWQPLVLPGLFQTEEYTRSIVRAGRKAALDETVERYVRLRQTRQAAITRANDPLNVSAIIDESVLRRMIGGAKVMKGQLQHLLEVSRLPNVIVQVLPLGTGAHAFIGGPVVILEFPQASDLDVAYLEGAAGDYFEEEVSKVAEYRREFELIGALALSKRQSATLIREVVDTLPS